MKATSIFGIAAILACGLSAPAMAAWDSIGTVEVGRGQDRDNAYTQFAGGIDRLQFVAENGDVNCRFIRAFYRNGHIDTIFQGTIRRGEARTINLPGQAAHIQKLNFSCSGDRARQTLVDIRADISTPSYREEWRKSPGWAHWSSVFHWGPPPNLVASPSWRPVGTQTFGHTVDSGRSYPGAQAWDIQTVGLRSDADARCNWIWVTFRSGQRVNLVNGGPVELLPRQMMKFDLPGNSHHISRVEVACHAVQGRHAAIQLFVRG